MENVNYYAPPDVTPYFSWEYQQWVPETYPYSPYPDYPNITVPSITFDYSPYVAISPSGTKYERKDLPVVELQLRNQCGYTVVKKVDKVVSCIDGFLKIYYKIGREKKIMMILESNVLAIHKTGWK